MADMVDQCVLAFFALLSWSVSEGGDVCEVIRSDGHAETADCDHGCCEGPQCCSPIIVWIPLRWILTLTIAIITTIILCVYQICKRRRLQRKRAAAVGTMDITVVENTQHPGYGYDQPETAETAAPRL